MESANIDSMCRCCAAEGMFKDIKTSYHWMGEEEVYGDMLRECFDVKLSSVEEGGICEVCITQLRNAANFKKQVLHTEKKFKRHLETRRFKPTEVKEEVSADNDNSSDDDRGADSEDDEDYVPEFEIPIKTETPEESKSRKRSAKATTSRAKKSRVDDDKSNPEPENVTATKSVEPENETEANSVDVISKLTPRQSKLRSVKLILLCSNATPLWLHSNTGYKCAYCENRYPQPDRLKLHTLEEHDDVTEAVFVRTAFYKDVLVTLDITALTCKLCSKNVDNINVLMEHLNTTHKKRMDVSVSNLFLPFKFDSNIFHCGLCTEKFTAFNFFDKHSKGHVKAVMCDICNLAFSDKNLLTNHNNTMHKPNHPTIYPKPVEKTSQKDKSSICRECGDRFPTFYLKKKHFRLVHCSQDFTCNACDRSFTNQKSLNVHRKRDHLMERPHVCSVCQKAFFSKAFLRKHATSHSNVMNYSCDECGKKFKLKTSLGPHMAIHSGYCRFACDLCGQKFVQKGSWKGHMRTKHQVIV